ncbi:hypothetical protein Xvie_02701 [Xenorhabdus vietnamensis]|uniref:Uncharacterized protein n=1 Tax=Xenorhabdus vietnamensis TaxID=351656 RepID=A0A1Y2SAB2_9GAMM|nr:hypothetical protein [Xenorhabdus vietnamensis]OTA15619.1 hypothetical protein Xvie_02701 [Xenorhabdus vietnamensis]
MAKYYILIQKIFDLNPEDIRLILSQHDRNIALNWKLSRSARINGASLNHADTVSGEI